MKKKNNSQTILKKLNKNNSKTINIPDTTNENENTIQKSEQIKKNVDIINNKKLDLGYVLCPVERRVELLLEIVSQCYDSHAEEWTAKVAIVLCHSNSVKFYTDLFDWLKKCPVIPFLPKDARSTRSLETYKSFSEGATGCIALTPSTLASLPGFSADFILHFDPPSDASEVCAVAMASTDVYTLVLRPQERSFVESLGEESLSLKERPVPWGEVQPLPVDRLQLRYKSYHFANITSIGAYKAYLDKIKYHKLRKHFNLKGCIYKEVSDSFGLPFIPKFVPEDPKSANDKIPKKPKQETASTVKFSNIYKRVVRMDDEDVKGQKLREKTAKRLMKQGKRFPDMKMKNLSRNLPRKAVVFDGKADDDQVKKAMGIPATGKIRLDVE